VIHGRHRLPWILSGCRQLEVISDFDRAREVGMDDSFSTWEVRAASSGTSGNCGCSRGRVRDQFSAYRNVEMKGGGSAKVFEKRTGAGGGASGLIRLRKEAISGGKV